MEPTTSTTPKMSPFMRGVYFHLVIAALALIITGISSLHFGGGPDTGTCAEWAKKDHNGKETDEATQARWVPVCERLLQERRAELSNDDKFVPNPAIEGSFLLKRKHAKIEKKLNAMGRKLEDEHLVKVKQPNKDGEMEVVKDLNGNECWASRTVAEEVMAADAEYHKRTKGRLKFRWCYRPAELQAIMYVRTYEGHGCKLPTPGQPWDKACMRKIRMVVGKPYGSSHGNGFAFDIANWARAKNELAAHGFIVGCKSHLGHNDKNHADWIGTQAGTWTKVSCNVRSWF